MNTIIRKTLLLPVLLLGTLLHAGEYTPSTVPNPKLAGQEYYVSNPDSIMTEDHVDWFNRLAQELEDSTRVELCAVALESIGDMDCFDFAYELSHRKNFITMYDAGDLGIESITHSNYRHLLLTTLKIRF